MSMFDNLLLTAEEQTTNTGTTGNGSTPTTTTDKDATPPAVSDTPGDLNNKPADTIKPEVVDVDIEKIQPVETLVNEPVADAATEMLHFGMQKARLTAVRNNVARTLNTRITYLEALKKHGLDDGLRALLKVDNIVNFDRTTAGISRSNKKHTFAGRVHRYAKPIVASEKLFTTFQAVKPEHIDATQFNSAAVTSLSTVELAKRAKLASFVKNNLELVINAINTTSTTAAGFNCAAYDQFKQGVATLGFAWDKGHTNNFTNATCSAHGYTVQKLSIVNTACVEAIGATSAVMTVLPTVRRAKKDLKRIAAAKSTLSAACDAKKAALTDVMRFCATVGLPAFKAVQLSGRRIISGAKSAIHKAQMEHFMSIVEVETELPADTVDTTVVTPMVDPTTTGDSTPIVEEPAVVEMKILMEAEDQLDEEPTEAEDEGLASGDVEETQVDPVDAMTPVEGAPEDASGETPTSREVEVKIETRIAEEALRASIRTLRGVHAQLATM